MISSTRSRLGRRGGLARPSIEGLEVSLITTILVDEACLLAQLAGLHLEADTSYITGSFSLQQTLPMQGTNHSFLFEIIKLVIVVFVFILGKISHEYTVEAVMPQCDLQPATMVLVHMLFFACKLSGQDLLRAMVV